MRACLASWAFAISACAFVVVFFREMALLLNIRTHTRLSQSGLIMSQSQTAVLLAFWAIRCADDVEIHSACERACCTISTKTFRVSAGLFHLPQEGDAGTADAIPGFHTHMKAETIDICDRCLL